MNLRLTMFALIVCCVSSAAAGLPDEPSMSWISAKPEVLTYRTTEPRGEGRYQLSSFKMDSLVEIHITVTSQGFMKSVSGLMTLAMRPLQSSSLIVINNQIIMKTRCSYAGGKMRIATEMIPYGKTAADSCDITSPIVDFSQVPMVPRALPLEKGRVFTFASLNPTTNALVPLTVTCIGPDSALGIKCTKISMKTFEGISVCWVETASPHRVIRIEQPESHRVTELMGLEATTPTSEVR